MTSASDPADAGFIVPARLNSGELPGPASDANDDAVRFLAALTAGGQTTFQTFDDRASKSKHRARILHGPLQMHAARLHALNRRGAGVFVLVNQGDGLGRKAENVVAARALFVDLDGAPLEPVMAAPIAPHIVVETSPGKWHAYWLVDGIPLESFSHLQVQLAKKFNADASVKDLPRVMRLPGFLHNKGAPCRTRLVSVREGPRIGLEAFVEAFGITPTIQVGERNTRLFNAAAGLNRAGIPKKSAQARVVKINRADTAMPLDDDEVVTIVDNAYSYEVRGFSMMPHAVVDTPEFAALSAAAAKLLIYAMRRHRPGKAFALPHTEFNEVAGLKNRKQFRAAIDELIASRFMVMTRDFVASVKKAGRVCALYQLHDRVQLVR